MVVMAADVEEGVVVERCLAFAARQRQAGPASTGGLSARSCRGTMWYDSVAATPRLRGDQVCGALQAKSRECRLKGVSHDLARGSCNLLSRFLSARGPKPREGTGTAGILYLTVCDPSAWMVECRHQTNIRHSREPLLVLL